MQLVNQNGWAYMINDMNTCSYTTNASIGTCYSSAIVYQTLYIGPKFFPKKFWGVGSYTTNASVGTCYGSAIVYHTL